MTKAVFNKPIFHIFLIASIGILAYSNTFHSSFQFDDLPAIVNNPVIKNLQFFIEPSKAKVFKGWNEYQMLIQRYVSTLTFALNFWWNGLNVAGYHIVNLVIHIINGVLVYYLVLLTFSTPHLEKSSLRERSRYIALLSSLLFISHPLQTQAVTYISQRNASLATMFYFLSLVGYIRWKLSNIKLLNPSLLNVKSGFPYLVSITSAVLAMKTKEIAFTLPLTIALYEVMFFRGNIKSRLLYLVPLLLTMLIIPVTYIDLGKPVGELMNNIETSTNYKGYSRLDYLFTEFRVLITYIRLLNLPVRQNLFYDYPLYHSFLDPRVFFSFLLLFMIFGLGVFLLFRSINGESSMRFMAFGIFWFFITISVESSIIPLHVIYEHRVYLPSFGFFVLISVSVFIILNRINNKLRTVVISAVATVIIVLAVATYARNNIWSNEISLWQDVVSKSPNHTLGHLNLGDAYQSQGLIDKAIEQYQITVGLNPFNAKGHNNLGSAYMSKGLLDKAVEQFQIGIMIDPSYFSPHFNLGLAYQSQGLIDKAIEQYRIAVELDPQNTWAREFLDLILNSKEHS